LTIAPVTLATLGLGYEVLPESIQTEVLRTVSDIDVASELLIFRSGYLQQLPLRAELSFSNQIFGTLFESGWQAAGCMLLGMAAVKAKFFETAPQYARMAAALFGVGLLITAAGILISLQGDFAPSAWLLGQSLHMAGSAGVAFGWVTLIITLSSLQPLQGWMDRVGRLGRVAFSAYIMQSLLGLFVFSGAGFAQYGSWTRTQLLFAPFLIWGVQVLLAKAWTSRFRVGPIEAVWRGLYRGDFSLGRISEPEA
jgi:uncharacterized protein